MKKGFTLIEVLVVILIIAGLAAMALPQYETAVDTSRFAALMPIAKNIKDAQEAYYMSNGQYTVNLDYLDWQIKGEITGAKATLQDGTVIEISEAYDYDYVKVTNKKLKNNYIVYQESSKHFPGEIHCEALTDSLRAQRLCENLDGYKIADSVTEGYDTYVLVGKSAAAASASN